MKKLPSSATSLCRFSNSRVFYVFASAPLRAFLRLCKGDLRLCKGTACLTTAVFYVFARASVGTLGPPLCKDVNIFGGNCSITLSIMSTLTSICHVSAEAFVATMELSIAFRRPRQPYLQSYQADCRRSARSSHNPT